MRGTMGPENANNSGKLVLDRSGGDFNLGLLGSAPNLSQYARLATNTDSNDFTRGLKESMTFAVTARYDLIPPALGEAYGIRLENRTNIGALGSDILDLRVRNNNGTPMIQFRDTDQLRNTQVSFDRPLELGHSQIEFMFDHPTPGADLIYGRYRYVDAGIPGIWSSFDNTFVIFDGETFTRATFIAVHAVPEPATLTLLAIGLVGFGLQLDARWRAPPKPLARS